MALSEYESSLECPICLEPYDLLQHLPKMMSCLHTTCITCVSSLIQPQSHRMVDGKIQIPQNRLFRCCICRTEINSSSVQTNRYIAAHLNDLKQLQAVQSTPSFTAPSAPPYELDKKTHSNAGYIDLQQFCCLDCRKSAQNQVCMSHNRQALPEFCSERRKMLSERAVKLKDKAKLQEIVLKREVEQTESLLSALDSLRIDQRKRLKQCQDLSAALQSLLTDWQDTESTMQLNERAVILKEQTTLMHNLRDKAIRLENSDLSSFDESWQLKNGTIFVRADDFTFVINKLSS